MTTLKNKIQWLFSRDAGRVTSRPSRRRGASTGLGWLLGQEDDAPEPPLVAGPPLPTARTRSSMAVTGVVDLREIQRQKEMHDLNGPFVTGRYDPAETHHRQLDVLNKETDRLNRRIGVLRDALLEYANPENWSRPASWPDDEWNNESVFHMGDGTFVARVALEGPSA